MKLTILMFHRVEEIPPDAAYPRNFVTPAQFTAQLTALHGWGYRSITFDDWAAYRAGRYTLPKKPVIFTFDDGYRSVAEVAWPRLQAHGFGATTFLVTGQIGGTNAWDAADRQDTLLSADDVLALRRQGMRFGSHTRTHRPLAKLTVSEAETELRSSRRDLENLLGEPVYLLAYPFNNQNRDVRQAARRTGYTMAVRGTGRMNGKKTDPLALRRIGIDFRMSPRRLRWRLLEARWLRP